MTTPRIYVGTYAKYNSGSIAGEWIDLDDFDSLEDFEERSQEVHKDEEDPELMFQDWEGIPDEFISESSIDGDFWDYLETVKASHLDVEVFEAAAELSIPYDSVEDAYQGEFSSAREFAQEYADNCGLIDHNASWPQNCLDWDAAARDLMCDYSEHGGHYFVDNY